MSKDRDSRHSIQKANHYITRVGISRFHSYFIPISKALNERNDGVIGVDDVLRLYKFDRRLRLLTLDALERIEIATKTYICNELAAAHGANFLRPSVEPLGDKRASTIAQNIQRSPWRNDVTNLEVEDVYRVATTGDVVDAMTLGQASKIFADLPEKQKRRVASSFSTNDDHFKEWLRRFTFIRNTGAHHARLWNCVYKNKIAIPGSITRQYGNVNVDENYRRRFFSSAILIYHCLRHVARRTRWHQRLYELMNAKDLNPEGVNLHKNMAFPEEWHRMPLWNGAGNSRV